jgi:pimeloyl-ACP methyl ester carboxylesterase
MTTATLVLVPGLMCDEAVWSDVRARMGSAAEGSVVPDHGFCDDIEGMAVQILRSVPGPLAVAGHSMGGRVALEMCRLAPDRVQRLALPIPVTWPDHQALQVRPRLQNVRLCWTWL